MSDIKSKDPLRLQKTPPIDQVKGGQVSGPQKTVDKGQVPTDKYVKAQPKAPDGTIKGHKVGGGVYGTPVAYTGKKVEIPIHVGKVFDEIKNLCGSGKTEEACSLLAGIVNTLEIV